MVNAGGVEIEFDEENGWEVTTKDGSDSAQREVMVLVTEEGCEILCY